MKNNGYASRKETPGCFFMDKNRYTQFYYLYFLYINKLKVYYKNIKQCIKEGVKWIRQDNLIYGIF